MIPELPNDKVSGCISGQYPYQKAHKITRSKIMSLGCLWGSVLTGKLQVLSIAKQCSLFGKPDSIKSRKQQHV